MRGGIVATTSPGPGLAWSNGAAASAVVTPSISAATTAPATYRLRSIGSIVARAPACTAMQDAWRCPCYGAATTAMIDVRYTSRGDRCADGEGERCMQVIEGIYQLVTPFPQFSAA